MPVDIIAEAFARSQGHAYQVLTTAERELYDRAAERAVDELIEAKIILGDDDTPYETLVDDVKNLEQDKDELEKTQLELEKTIDELKAEKAHLETELDTLDARLQQLQVVACKAFEAADKVLVSKGAVRIKALRSVVDELGGYLADNI